YAAIIAKTFDLPRQRGTGAGVFSDVPADFWASSAIRVAAGMGFISGFPDGTFRPQQNLTRVQALVSLVSGLGLSGGNPNLLVFYSDRAQIPSYATEAIATATQRRLVVNYPKPNQLDPMRNITRAEIAAWIYQALVSTGRAEAIASSYIVNPNLSLPSFTDIQQHWTAEFVRRLANLNLITGFADGSFKPDEPLSRSQYAALVVKVFNPTPIRPDTKFIDIPADFWALPVISQAYRGGFLSGYPDQTFHPQQSLRRIDLMASLVHGLSLPSADVKVLEIYEDRDSIPAYAKSAVAAATQAGIVVSYPNPKLLQPKQEASRAEAIAFMYQALVRTGRVSAISSPYIVSTQPS
ncbi:S-layer homology domain-containing protein, partial [Allocoleopsis sp.]|uniref:S-layer homology domain-containing protein n=1 Tax=Allocoleopsis sp. TaxID=3088169 RepID=UPI002FCFE0CA